MKSFERTDVIALTPGEWADLVKDADSVPVAILHPDIQEDIKEYNCNYVMVSSNALCFKIFVRGIDCVMFYYKLY